MPLSSAISDMGAKNKQIGNSASNRTSWLSGKVVCEKCGHTMTMIKGKINKEEIRRYFNCIGKSHQRICTGTKVTIDKFLVVCYNKDVKKKRSINE